MGHHPKSAMEDKAMRGTVEEECYILLKKSGIEVCCVLDNVTEKWGKQLLG